MRQDNVYVRVRDDQFELRSCREVTAIVCMQRKIFDVTFQLPTLISDLTLPSGRISLNFTPLESYTSRYGSRLHHRVTTAAD